MELIWIIVAGCLALAAGTLLWFHRFDGAFVCGALGILAWFMNMRSRLKKEIPKIEDIPEPSANGVGVQDED